MNSNLRIAKALVRMAKMLVAFSRSQLETELSRKRSDLNKKSLKEHLDCLDKMDAKEQKAALYWINKKRLILPEDLSKFNEAMNLINKQHLDFQKFDAPMEIINRDDESTKRIKSQDSRFNPNSESAFKNKKSLGKGVVIYDVDNSKEGQLAVRKAIDTSWGYDKNPWCLAARDKEVDKGHELDQAWTMWNHYNAYPKRIAFQNRRLIGLSAGRNKQLVEWWDKDDKSHKEFPVDGVEDDYDFLLKYGKLNIAQNPNTSKEISNNIYMQLAEDEDKNVRINVVRNPNAPVDVLRKLAEDEVMYVRSCIAEHPNTPVDVLKILAEDEDLYVKYCVADNSNATADVLKELAEDEGEYVRASVAENLNTPADVLKELAEDENKGVREQAQYNPNYFE